MKKESGIGKLLKTVNHYIVFFLTAAFLITCCMMLFLSTMSSEMGITFTDAHISAAAKLTFGNVVLLSLIFTLMDMGRRKISVNRPIKRITDAAERIMQGDFTVRISPVKGIFGEDSFNNVIECFNKMAEELSGIETLRTDFIANVSHELKTPLAVMQNYAVMLQQPDITEEQRIEYSKSIADACRRLANLIMNILKLNKLENQKIFPSVEEYDLGEQLCGCLLQFENQWERRNIDIETHIEDGVTVRADSELLSLVWNNLLSNAFKFTDDGGKIGLSLYVQGESAVIKVSDTGCGMTPEVGAHIFEKFYQGDSSHSVQGNGLGLALVKRVADIMKGEISVESIYGKGSTFTVTIPRG